MSEFDFIKDLEARMEADIIKAEKDARAKVIEHYRKVLNGDFSKFSKSENKTSRFRLSGEDVMAHKLAILEAIKSSDISEGISLKEIAAKVSGINKKYVSRALKLLTSEGRLSRQGDRRFAKYTLV